MTQKIDVNAPQSEDVAALKAELAEMKAAMAKLTAKSEPDRLPLLAARQNPQRAPGREQRRLHGHGQASRGERR